MVGKNITVCLLLLIFAIAMKAEDSKETTHKGITRQCPDSVIWQRPDTGRHTRKHKPDRPGKSLNVVGGIDTTYIELQKDNFTGMAQKESPSDTRTRTNSAHRTLCRVAMDISWIYHRH